MSEQAMRGRLTLDELRDGLKAGEFHTVVLAMVDMQGRLQGKRLTADYFVNEVAGAQAEVCNYQLAVDVAMNTVDGYEHAPWATACGDFAFVPDMSTLRRQLERPADRGLVPDACSEREFVDVRDRYEAAWRKAYRELTPANYAMVHDEVLDTARLEPLKPRTRNDMQGAGLTVLDSKGEG